MPESGYVRIDEQDNGRSWFPCCATWSRREVAMGWIIATYTLLTGILIIVIFNQSHKGIAPITTTVAPTTEITTLPTSIDPTGSTSIPSSSLPTEPTSGPTDSSSISTDPSTAAPSSSTTESTPASTESTSASSSSSSPTETSPASEVTTPSSDVTSDASTTPIELPINGITDDPILESPKVQFSVNNNQQQINIR